MPRGPPVRPATRWMRVVSRASARVIAGGLVTGLGLAVTEALVAEGGQILNGHCGAYTRPTLADIPALETVLVQSRGGEGP